MARSGALDIGEALIEARRARGLTVEQAANDTRIAQRFLEALEAEEFDELPAPVYVRGFMRSYANYLGIDPQPLVDELASRESSLGYGPRPDASHSRPQSDTARSPSTNPFRPQTPGPSPAPANITPFARTGSEADDSDAVADGVETVDEQWEANEPGYEPWPPAIGTYPAREQSQTAGLLLERATLHGGSMRWSMIAALAGLAGVGALAAFFLLGGNGDSAAGPGLETPTAAVAGTGTVIEVRTPTLAAATSPGSGNPSPARTTTTTPTPGGTATPGATVSATATSGVPAVPGATATQAPTQVPTLQPTATLPPLPTPVPPTPTPTAVVHPFTYDECNRNTTTSGELDCGSSPYRVVCSPSGWFVDLPPYFPAESLGWPVEWPATKGGIANACGP